MKSDLFIVKADFRDKIDGHGYVEGDIYPHNIHKLPTEERTNELIELGYIAPYIQLDVESKEANEEANEEYPKHVGGGYYELSNGTKVKGKEAAETAENDLKGE